jgi:hypothetical protein
LAGARIHLLPAARNVDTHRPKRFKRALFASAERYANRVAEVIFATAGPLFWLALMFVAVAASLGWRLFLL